MVWFDRRNALSAIVPDPAIIVGGTGLLREFTNFVALSAGGRLSITSPFAGARIGKEIASWMSMPHEKLDVSVITNTSRDAATVEREIGSLPWRSLVIRVHARLHAKVYVLLTPEGAGACLVGSHNLTFAGAHTNEEAGIMFISTRDPDVSRVIQACDDQVSSLSRTASAFVDTVSWPMTRAS